MQVSERFVQQGHDVRVFIRAFAGRQGIVRDELAGHGDALPLAAAWAGQAEKRYFVIEVVDKQTGRGVPLVCHPTQRG